MKPRCFTLGMLLMLALIGSGCDSAQYGTEKKAEPKAEADTMGAGEGEKMASGGALMAPSGTAGAVENDEGISHYNLGHFDVAQDHFQKALAANPDLAEAHYNLALALDKLGNHGEATNHFKMALELAPDNPGIRDSGILKAHVGG